MWDPPGPGIEPVSPALAGGFLTTVPPGKSLKGFFKVAVLKVESVDPWRKSTKFFLGIHKVKVIFMVMLRLGDIFHCVEFALVIQK